MVKQNRLASKLSHANCSSEDMPSDLLIEGGCCSLHKKEHHYTLRPKDTTKSKPLIKMKKIICFPNSWLEDEYLFKERELCVPNCWSRQQLILEHCIQGDFGIDKILGLLQRTYHWHGLKQVHQSVQQRL